MDTESTLCFPSLGSGTDLRKRPRSNCEKQCGEKNDTLKQFDVAECSNFSVAMCYETIRDQLLDIVLEEYENITTSKQVVKARAILQKHCGLIGSFWNVVLVRDQAFVKFVDDDLVLQLHSNWSTRFPGR